MTLALSAGDVLAEHVAHEHLARFEDGEGIYLIGFLDCENPGALQRICERLSECKIDAFFRKWLAQLPHPFTGAERRAG